MLKQFILSFGMACILSLVFIRCEEPDDIPPVITLKGSATVDHILNQPYNDAGATATDETDGNISSSIFIESNVNVDLIGEYTVTYKAVDKAGNEAEPVSRTVRVKNTANSVSGVYAATEAMIFPGVGNCAYNSSVWVDSTVNQRLVFNGFACIQGVSCFFDVSDTVVVIPYQAFEDLSVTYWFQGSGWLNDTAIFIEYSRKSISETSYWYATFIRQQ